MRVLITLFIFLSLNVQAKTVVFLGDSLTAGYGLEKEQAYPSLLAEKLKDDFPELKIINGGISGSTAASAMSRLKWFAKLKPQIIVLALGANDGLRGQDVEKMKSNLESAIKWCQEHNIKVLLLGMQVPPNYGEKYTKAFKDVYPTLAKKYDIGLVPFLLKGVGGVKELNQIDGIHPNAKGHKILADTVEKELRKLL